MDKLIIVCATNKPGGLDVPDLKSPVTAREIADSGREAVDAGAAILHVHAPFTKKYQERIGMHAEVWLELVPLIHQEIPGIIVEHGTGGLPYITMDHHYPPLHDPEIASQMPYLGIEKPDMIVLQLGFHQHPEADFKNPRGIYTGPTREDLAHWMRLCHENGVKPSFEAGNQTGDLYNFQWLAARGLIDSPAFLGFVFGGEGMRWVPAKLEEFQYKLDTLREVMPNQKVLCWLPDGTWEGKTREQLIWAMTMGAHIRTGFEVSPYYSEGVVAKSNAQLVERVVRIAREIGREIASPDEARQMLGLPRVIKNT